MRAKTVRGHVAPLPHYSWRSSQLPGDILVTECQYRCTTHIMGACLLSLNGNVELNSFTRPEHPLLYLKKLLTVFCPERDCAKGRDSRDPQQAYIMHSLGT